MGWENSHLHQFLFGKTHYSASEFGLDGTIDEESVRLDEVAGPKSKFQYVYDFGDSWGHEIVVEKVFDAEPKVSYPRCVAGKRVGPPEDVGGVWGYDQMLEALDDESHPRRDEFLEWVDEDYDPEAFDIEAVNEAFK